jgi:esterase/lipase
MPDISRRVKWIARTPAWYNAYRVRALLVEEDHREFDHDYTAHYEPGVTKGTEVGRPFLLKPLCAKGAVVLIHGYMAAPLETRAMAEHLRAQGYAVYGVRLKGHGTSPADLAATTWEDWRESIDHAYAVMRTISDRVIVGGFSMGAGLALLTAARTPETTRAVFAISAPLHLRSSAARYAPSIVKVNTLLRRFRWGRSYQWEYVENRPENPHINYLVNPVAGVAELTEAMEVMQEALKDLRVPTLILQGSRDPVVNPNSGSAIFERIATEHKELLVLERDRHGIINGPGTAEVFARVCAFLEWALQTAGDNAKPTGTVEAAPQSDYTSTGNFVAK